MDNTVTETLAPNGGSEEGNISTTNWDQDTKTLPRLQLVDEEQKFT